jgi:hypothetical protein
MRSDKGIVICKFRLQLQLMLIMDYIITNSHFFKQQFFIDFVPYGASPLNPLKVCKILT